MRPTAPIGAKSLRDAGAKAPFGVRRKTKAIRFAACTLIKTAIADSKNGTIACSHGRAFAMSAIDPSLGSKIVQV